MGVFVKICGIAHEDDARAVAALQPDAMGFVLWPGSKRGVTVTDVAAWTPLLPPDILKVGVFVDATADEANHAAAKAGLDIVQLHGAESARVSEAVTVRTWKVVHLDRMDPASLDAYHVDAFVVDSYSADAPGGTGITANWDAARAFVRARDTRVVLAGGLTPANIREAVQAVGPWGVDVSSGVEAKPGRKDLGRVRSFIEQCRNL
jgi:phosphoribosylanthranilate isomerase